MNWAVSGLLQTVCFAAVPPNALPMCGERPSDGGQVDRSFTEVELRGMLERASSFLPDVLEGRFVIETRHASRPWHVILEPDDEDQLLVVITAYPVERS